MERVGGTKYGRQIVVNFITKCAIDTNLIISPPRQEYVSTVYAVYAFPTNSTEILVCTPYTTKETRAVVN
jgi:hypothetical protein